MFTYQEDEDIEFIKGRAQFFFREGKSSEVEPSDDAVKSAIIKSVDGDFVEVVSVIHKTAGLNLRDAKQLVDLVRKGFYQKLPLDHLSANNKHFLLSKLRDYNVRFTLQ